MATYLSLIRESNLPKNVRGRARGKHHTADNSSATALKKKNTRQSVNFCWRKKKYFIW